MDSHLTVSHLGARKKGSQTIRLDLSTSTLRWFIGELRHRLETHDQVLSVARNSFLLYVEAAVGRSRQELEQAIDEVLKVIVAQLDTVTHSQMQYVIYPKLHTAIFNTASYGYAAAFAQHWLKNPSLAPDHPVDIEVMEENWLVMHFTGEDMPSSLSLIEDVSQRLARICLQSDEMTKEHFLAIPLRHIGVNLEAGRAHTDVTMYDLSAREAVGLIRARKGWYYWASWMVDAEQAPNAFGENSILVIIREGNTLDAESLRYDLHYLLTGTMPKSMFRGTPKPEVEGDSSAS